MRTAIPTSLLLGLALAAFGCGHPSDDNMLRLFNEHHTELEKLVAMFESDHGLGRVGRGFTRPEDPSRVGITRERINEYQRLCAAIGAPDCIEGYDAAYARLSGGDDAGLPEVKDPIWIHVSSIGLSISGSSKGFLYSKNPAFEAVQDLDRVRAQRSGTWIRHIEGSWYLYYDYED